MTTPTRALPVASTIAIEPTSVASEVPPGRQGITTRIDSTPGNHSAYGSIDGDEQYLGSRETRAGAEQIARDWRYDMAMDGHCPEQAAAIAMEYYGNSTSGFDGGADIDPGDPEFDPDAGSDGDPDADYIATRDGRRTAIAHCPCGMPATITVRNGAGTIYERCGSCFEDCFQNNTDRTDAWEVLARVPSGPLALTCEVCGAPKAESGFTLLRATDPVAICDDCRRATAVQMSGAVPRPDLCQALAELALTDPCALRAFLRSQTPIQRDRLAWRYCAWIKSAWGIERTPGYIVEGWEKLVNNAPPVAA